MYARRTMMALTLAALLLWAGGCDDGALTPDDGSLFLTVSPTSLTIDLFALEESAEASIIVRLFGASGLPIKDADVSIFSEGGTLASQANSCVANRCALSQTVCVIDADCASVVGVPLKTDAEGYVRDTLTVRLDAPSSIDVTVQSGSLTQTETVSLTILGLPDPQPVLSINSDFGCIASAEGRFDVILDGRDSVPGAGQTENTCYQFEIGAPISEIHSGPDGTYTVFDPPSEEVTVDITLKVSDVLPIDCPRGGSGIDSSLLGPDSATETITFDGTPPDASASIPSTGTVGVAVSLSGGGSMDDYSGITQYSWDCDLDNPGTMVEEGVSASCTYSAAGTYRIQLTVTDGCGFTDSTDPRTITINTAPASAP